MSPVIAPRILLLARTVRWLKLRQVVYQLRYRVLGRLPVRLRRLNNHQRPIPWKRIKPGAPFLNRPGIRAADIENHRFTFLNRYEHFEGRLSWAAPDQNRLWRYNLHYFDYLLPDRPLAANAAQNLMRDWAARVNPGMADAWDPFPISLRTVNWIKYLSFHPIEAGTADALAASIFVQVKWLEKNLEYHLLANHLFKNIKALIFAGLFFEGSTARRWLNTGMRMLRKELSEQVMPDGGHFERSPMYHSMILEDVLDLLNVLSVYEQHKAVCAELSEKAIKMQGFLAAMCHPDGGMALFNDAAFGIEPSMDRLVRYMTELTGLPEETGEEELKAFRDSGYFIMSPSPGNRMVIDCGEIGPDYQTGHSHCDTLSFELSLAGQRVVVDSGCCQYEEGEIRHYNRGNAGHNAMTVDGQDQSEIWAAHRCGRRAHPNLHEFRKDSNGTLRFSGSHDGYRKLRGSPVHRRTITWAGGQIHIEDTIAGAGKHGITSRLHIHPDLSLDMDGGVATVSANGRPLAAIRTNGDQGLSLEDGWYCPEFGKRIHCTVLTTKSHWTALPFSTGWEIHALH